MDLVVYQPFIVVSDCNTMCDGTSDWFLLIVE
jgi:hypothetical protein